MTAARDIDAQAADWLIDQEEHDNWGPSDQARLDAWLDESPAHFAAYWRLEASWSRTELVSDMRSFGVRVSYPSRNLWRRVAGIAAALIVLVTLGLAGASYFNTAREQVFATAVGGRKTIELADGSQIELNTNTELRVRVSSESRSATLVKGEAFFDIHHDSRHPFAVMAGDHRVTDLGTKFLIRKDSERLTVMLQEGRAQIDSAFQNHQQRTAILRPGDEAIATANTISITRKTQKRIANDLSWRHGVLVFNDMTLNEVAREFNRYNDAKIVISDEAAGRLKISGTMPSNDIEELVRMSQNFFGLHAQRRRGEIVISH